MEIYEVYTDGAYSWNLDVGGWAYSIYNRNEVITNSGAEEGTTSNRMEITAVLESLKVVMTMAYIGDEITIYSDSKYVVNTINRWIDKWIKYQTFHEKANTDLWEEFLDIRGCYEINAQWVKAHCGIEKNEIVDDLAVKALVSFLENNNIKYKQNDIFEYRKNVKKINKNKKKYW